MIVLTFLLLLCGDFALPTTGAYQPLDPDVQSVLGARLSVQATTAVSSLTLQPRLPAGAQHDPLRLKMERRESPMARPFAGPLARHPQHECEALNAADPA